MSSEPRVLVLGAGYVSGPLIEYLSRDKTNITVASLLQDDLDRTSRLCPEVNTMLMDVSIGSEELEKQVDKHDLVASMLPYSFNPEVARLCIKHKKDMVTASYICPAMRKLHQAALDAGITILNEMGVDPGIDHMLAMECFDEVKEAGGKVTSYTSYCGGIPAPENSASPLMYKFSWYPKGVLLSCLSSAKYLKDGKVINVEGNGRLFEETVPLTYLPGLNLEGFPNRDSTHYLQEYGIESAKTIQRGTIRYKGFAEAVQGLIILGLLDTQPDVALHPDGPMITWKQYICGKFDKSEDIPTDSLKDLVFEKVGRDVAKCQPIVDLGLLADGLIEKKTTPIDTLSNYLSKKLAYGINEKDMVLMRHEVGIQWGDGTKEQRSIDFISYGDPGGFSAMAKTVGLPSGIAAKMILTGEIQTKGVIAPLSMEIYKPVLQRLMKEGLSATKTSKFC